MGLLVISWQFDSPIKTINSYCCCNSRYLSTTSSGVVDKYDGLSLENSGLSWYKNPTIMRMVVGSLLNSYIATFKCTWAHLSIKCSKVYSELLLPACAEIYILERREALGFFFFFVKY